METVSTMDAKFLWGNSTFDYKVSEANGNSGGILCIWDSNVFLKEQHILSDNFVALFGTWVSTNTKLLIISIYAPQSRMEKRQLWNYIISLISRFHGECILMGDFNEVRNADERMGSIFNSQGAADFNDFISNAGLSEVQLEGYSFTWSHPSASKMSKLDRFLVSDGLMSLFPNILAVCLDRTYLSDQSRPILLRDVHADYVPTPFRFTHSYGLKISGFRFYGGSGIFASYDFNEMGAMSERNKSPGGSRTEARFTLCEFFPQILGRPWKRFQPWLLCGFLNHFRLRKAFNKVVTKSRLLDYSSLKRNKRCYLKWILLKAYDLLMDFLEIFFVHSGFGSRVEVLDFRMFRASGKASVFGNAVRL
ncbi:RNA-directed DNA polymerase, eukaryota [Tanacetum coccineum]